MLNSIAKLLKKTQIVDYKLESYVISREWYFLLSESLQQRPLGIVRVHTQMRHKLWFAVELCGALPAFEATLRAQCMIPSNVPEHGDGLLEVLFTNWTGTGLMARGHVLR